MQSQHVLLVVVILTAIYAPKAQSQLVYNDDHKAVILAHGVASSYLASDARLFAIIFNRNPATGWDMDSRTGKATFWVYAFFSKTLDSAISVTTYEIAGQGLVASAYPMQRPVSRIDTLTFPANEWIGSEAAMTVLAKGPALDYFTRHNNPVPYYAMLFLDRKDYSFKWYIKFAADGDTIACAVNAISGNAIGGCEGTTSNGIMPPPPIAADIQLWPNPVRRSQDVYVTCLYAASHLDSPTLLVTDISGRIISLHRLDADGIMLFKSRIPVNSLAPGTYVITVFSTSAQVISKLLTVGR